MKHIVWMTLGFGLMGCLPQWYDDPIPVKPYPLINTDGQYSPSVNGKQNINFDEK